MFEIPDGMKSGLCILTLGLVMFLPQSCCRTEEKSREPVSVKVQEVSRSDQTRPQVYIGHIEAAKTTVISARYPGKLVRLYVRKGQKLSAGDTLAFIDSPAVKSMYETAKASFQQASDALDRVNQVYSSGSVSELKMVEVKTAYAKAVAAYDAAKRAMDDCAVRAPYYGVVGEVFAHEGVEVGAVEPLLKYLDVSSVEVHASIPENEYSSFSVGQKARVVVDAAACSAQAVLSSKGFEASSLSHSYDFVFRLSTCSGKMMPGMVCKVYMTTGAGSSVVIPSSAVRVDAEGRYVWCIDSCGVVQKRHIKVNGYADKGIVVEEGLSEGDLLVVEGARKISTGMSNIRIDECR